jgi:predicted AAA+ superfamily ATPase
MKQIIRTSYINEINLYKDKHIIKIITGVRRAGKSTILEQYKRFIVEKYQINLDQIISYDFNDLRFRNLSYKELYSQIIQKSKNDSINYVFLDEVQDIKKFEECVISLYENKKYKFDIYITGSNSRMFSSGLATLFTGRNVEIKVYPLSFKEYYQYLYEEYKIYDKYKTFNLFLQYGSLPICLDSIDSPDVMKTKITSVIKDSIQKDIFYRHSIRNVDDFNRIVKYLLMNIGQPISTTSISNTINSHNRNLISAKTIDRYIE